MYTIETKHMTKQHILWICLWSSACEVAASLHVLLVTCYLPDIPRNYISVYIIEYTPKFVSSQICNFTDLKITLLINRCKSASEYSNITYDT